MKRVTLTGALILVMAIIVAQFSTAWGTYTPLILDVVESEDWMCSGTNPFGIHNWDNNDHVGDTHGAVYSVQELPDQYQIKFTFTIMENPQEDWAPLTRPYGSPEFLFVIADGTAQFPMISTSVHDVTQTKSKIVFSAQMMNIRAHYYGSDDKKYNLDPSGMWFTFPVDLEALLDDPYVPYTRSVEIIKDAVNYTFNYYGDDDSLMTTVSMAISAVRDVPGDQVILGDPVVNDHSINCTIEYLGTVLPPGSYRDLEQGWNLVPTKYAEAIAAGNLRFSNDGGATQVDGATAEVNGWVQATLYTYDANAGIFKTVPDDNSTFESNSAYWVYADQAGITLVMLW
jgi:hypothetical protein